jgi:universal stress protein A
MKTSTDSQPLNPGPAQTTNDPTRRLSEEPLQISKILVSIDFSDESLQALEYAVPLATRCAAAIHLVYVGETFFSEISLTPAVLSDAEIVAQMKKKVESRFPLTIPAEDCHLRHGRPFREISDLAVEIGAGLLVIATRDGHGFEHLMRGSTAGQVVRHARTPVLVVRSGGRPRIKPGSGELLIENVLVPVDFSSCAREGASYAALFAATAGANLVLLHVVEPPSLRRGDEAVQSGSWPALEEEARTRAEEKLSQLVRDLPMEGISARTEVAVGLPVEELAERTRHTDVDMVITSTHGRTGLRHIIIGSTAEKLVRMAACPVLVVPSHSC